MKTISAHRLLNANFKEVQPLPLLDPAMLPSLARGGACPAASWSATAAGLPCHLEQNENDLCLPLLHTDHSVGERAVLAVLGLGALFCLAQVLTATLVISGRWYAVEMWVSRLIG